MGTLSRRQQESPSQPRVSPRANPRLPRTPRLRALAHPLSAREIPDLPLKVGIAPHHLGFLQLRERTAVLLELVLVLRVLLALVLLDLTYPKGTVRIYRLAFLWLRPRNARARALHRGPHRGHASRGATRW